MSERLGAEGRDAGSPHQAPVGHHQHDVHAGQPVTAGRHGLPPRAQPLRVSLGSAAEAPAPGLPETPRPFPHGETPTLSRPENMADRGPGNKNAAFPLPPARDPGPHRRAPRRRTTPDDAGNRKRMPTVRHAAEAGRTRGAAAPRLVAGSARALACASLFASRAGGRRQASGRGKARERAREGKGGRGWGGGNLTSRDRGGAARGVSVEETEVKLGAQRRWRRRRRQRQRGGAGYCPRPL